MIEWLRRLISGNDAFVSYARADGSEYAVKLAAALARRKLSCHVDQFGTEPGAELPRSLLRALQRSSLLILVCTRAAARSENVAREVRAFVRTGKPIVPIDLDGTLRGAIWWPSVDGIPASREPGGAEADRPSEVVLTRVEQSLEVTSRSRRVQRVTIVVVGMIAVLGVVAALLGLNARQKGLEAAAAAEKERVATAQVVAAATRLQQRSLLTLASTQHDPVLGALVTLELDAKHVDPENQATALAVASHFGQMRLPIARLFASTGSVIDADLSPDGEALVIADQRGVRMWNADGRGQPVDLGAKPSPVGKVWFGPRGKHVVLVDKAVRIWNRSGKTVAPPFAVNEVGASAALSPDERRLAIQDGPHLSVYDLSTGKVVLELEGSGFSGTQFYRDADHILTFERNQISIYRVADGTRASTIKVNDYLAFGTIGPDGKVLSIPVNTGPAFLWDPVRGTGTQLAGAEDFANYGGFSAGGTEIELVSEYASTVFSASTLKTLRREAREACLGQQGRDVYAAECAGAAAPDATEQAPLLPLAGFPPSEPLRPDELARRRVFRTNGAAVTVWDRQSPTDLTVVQLGEHELDVTLGMAFSPHGSHLATRGAGDTYLMNTRNPKERVALGLRYGWGIEFSPDGRLVLAFTHDRAALWNGSSGEKVRELAVPERVQAGHWSPRGSWVVLSGPGGALVHNLRDPRRQLSFTAERAELKQVVMDPREQRVVTAYKDGTLEIWELGDRLLGPRLVRAHEREILDATFSPDGALLATASEDATVCVWNARAGSLVRKLTGPKEGVYATEFSRDGRYVLGETAKNPWLWSLEAKAKARPLTWLGKRVRASQFSPDMAYVVGLGEGGVLRWRVADPSDPVLFSAGNATDYALSQSGLIAVASTSGLSVWRLDAPTAKLHALPEGYVSHVAFSRDGAWVAMSRYDQMVLWKLHELPDELQALRERTSACLAPAERIQLFGEPLRDATKRYELCRTERGNKPSLESSSGSP